MYVQISFDHFVLSLTHIHLCYIELFRFRAHTTYQVAT